jgi:hypothetical protein
VAAAESVSLIGPLERISSSEGPDLVAMSSRFVRSPVSRVEQIAKPAECENPLPRVSTQSVVFFYNRRRLCILFEVCIRLVLAFSWRRLPSVGP